jgi:hypothetical protein
MPPALSNASSLVGESSSGLNGSDNQVFRPPELFNESSELNPQRIGSGDEKRPTKLPQRLEIIEDPE